MSDAELRELRRRAETEGDAGSWGRLAQGYVRDGRWDEAGWALVQARARGGENPEVEDALESEPLEEFSLRELPSNKRHATVSSLAWTPDGQTLVCGTDGRAVHVVNVRTGEWRRVARVEGWIRALSTDLEADVVFVASEIERDKAPVSVRVEGGNPVTEHVGFNRVVALHLGSGDELWRQEVPWGFAQPQLAAWRMGQSVSICTGNAIVDLSKRGAVAQVVPVPSGTSQLALTWTGTPVLVGSVTNHRAAGSGRVRDGLLQVSPDSDIEIATSHAARSFAANLAACGAALYPGELRLSPGGRYFASFYRNAHNFYLWDFARRNQRDFEFSHEVVVRALAWSPSGRTLAVSTQTGLVLLTLGDNVLARLDADGAKMGDTLASRLALIERLKSDPSAGATEWLVRLLERDVTSDDTPLEIVVAASRCLARRRQPVDRARLEAARARLPERPGVSRLADYRTTLDWLVLVLERARAGDRCSCSLPFPSALDHGSLEPTGSEPSTAFAVTLHRCTVCGRRWRVAVEVDARSGNETSHVAELAS